MSGAERLGVALVIDTLGRGGAERVLVSIANTLDDQRFRVHVVATRELGELARDLSPHIVTYSLDRRSRSDLRALHRFAAFLAERQIRLVHTHSHTAAYFVRLAQTLSRARWLHVVHDHYPLIDQSLAIRWTDRLLLSGVDYYFAVSEPLLRYAAERLRIPPDRREKLLNGIVIPESRVELGTSPLTIAQVARVMPQKNQMMALAAAERLREAHADFQWLLIGRTTSAYARECRETAKRMGLERHVVFLGERDDTLELLRGAQVGVLTSSAEGLPVALLEYMAASLPVVVTDVGDCALPVRASGGGIVVRSGDAEGFARALRFFAEDRDAARRAGEANHQYVKQQYGIDAMVSRIEAVYQDLFQDRPIRQARSAIG